MLTLSNQNCPFQPGYVIQDRQEWRSVCRGRRGEGCNDGMLVSLLYYFMMRLRGKRQKLHHIEGSPEVHIEG